MLTNGVCDYRNGSVVAGGGRWRAYWDGMS